MKKIISLIMIFMLSAMSLCGCSNKTSNGKNDTDGNGESKELNLFTWENMFPKEVLDGFTKETGIKVNYSNFDLDETMLSKLETAKGGDYDVVIADDYIVDTAIKQGLVQKLDKTKISNYGNINPIYQGRFYDKSDEYTVPYGAGVQTIVYNPDQVKVDIKGYEDLWNPELKGNIGIVANYRVIDGMALKVMNESYNTKDIAKIQEAGKKLGELAPNIRLIKDSNLDDDLISGEFNVAVMYTSQVTNVMMGDNGFKIVYPKEGIGFGIMPQFIPINAPHPDAALKFIDYILKPEVSAKCYEYIGYYCTNKAAESYIDEKYKAFLTLPEDLPKDKTEMIENISSEADEQHIKIWTEFKSKVE